MEEKIKEKIKIRWNFCKCGRLKYDSSKKCRKCYSLNCHRTVGRAIHLQEKYLNNPEREKNSLKQKNYYQKNKEKVRKRQKKWTQKLNEFANKRCEICNVLLNYRSSNRCKKHGRYKKIKQ